jgi:hypothetical protein
MITKRLASWGRPNTRVTSRQIDQKRAKPTIRVQFGLGKGLVGCVLQVLLGEAPQADETRM